MNRLETGEMEKTHVQSICTGTRVFTRMREDEREKDKTKKKKGSWKTRRYVKTEQGACNQRGGCADKTTSSGGRYLKRKQKNRALLGLPSEVV